MAFDERARRRLGDILAEHLGDEGSELLMAQLPPQGWNELATKTDVALLQADLEMAKVELRSEITSCRADLKTDISAARLETGRVRTELWRVTITIIGAVGGLLALFEYVLT